MVEKGVAVIKASLVFIGLHKSILGLAEYVDELSDFGFLIIGFRHIVALFFDDFLLDLHDSVPCIFSGEYKVVLNYFE